MFLCLKSLQTLYTSLQDSLQKVRELSETNRIVLDSFVTAKAILKNLTNLRKEAGLSQRDLAKLTGMKQPQIARYETHEEYPRLDTFIRIIDALNYTMNLEKKTCKKDNKSPNKDVSASLSK